MLSGPAKFNIEEEAKLRFVWDNTHSWIRSKTVNFAINYYPADDAAISDASTGKPTIYRDIRRSANEAKAKQRPTIDEAVAACS